MGLSARNRSPHTLVALDLPYEAHSTANLSCIGVHAKLRNLLGFVAITCTMLVFLITASHKTPYSLVSLVVNESGITT